MTPKPTLSLALLLLAAAGCGGGEADFDPLPAARARAAVALAGAERGPVPDRPDDAPDDNDPRADPDCPRCGGTGLTRTGDGLAEVPCDCVAGSSKDQDNKNQNGGDDGDRAAAKPSPRVLIFTADWCRGCAGMKPALAAAGPGFEVVDVDARPDLAAAYGVTAVPALVRLVPDPDGGPGGGARETARSLGPRDAAGLRRFLADGS